MKSDAITPLESARRRDAAAQRTRTIRDAKAEFPGGALHPVRPTSKTTRAAAQAVTDARREALRAGPMSPRAQMALALKEVGHDRRRYGLVEKLAAKRAAERVPSENGPNRDDALEQVDRAFDAASQKRKEIGAQLTTIASARNAPNQTNTTFSLD